MPPIPRLDALRTQAALAAGVARATALTRSTRSHPQVSGRLPVDAPEPLEVVRDEAGVPHVRAQSAQGAWWGLGFVQAQDRLFQIDSIRRLASGRVAEVLGPDGLRTDRLMRRLGLADRAGRDYAQVTPEEREALQAYARGFNAAVRSLPALPPEYALLGEVPEPWHPEHSLLLGRFLLISFSDNWPSELLRARLADALGPEAAAAVEPPYPGSGAPPSRRSVTGVPPRAVDALLDAYAGALGHGMPPGGGSNAWAIAGEHTRSGRPILANDPHLQPRAPSFFHVVHIRGGDLDVIGATVPGVPGVVSGHNGRVGWGITAGLSDSADCYIEAVDPEHETRYLAPGGWREGRVRIERIAVRGGDTVEERVLETRHGPVIGPALPGEHAPPGGGETERVVALRATALEDGAALRPLFALARAADVAEASRAVEQWPGPPFNFVFADREGHIGYRHGGQVPRRAPGEGLLPRDGATSAGPPEPLPPVELPALLDPPAGLVVSANEAPGSEHFLGADWCEPWRGERISELLRAREGHTVASQFPIQCDVVSLPLLRLRDLVLPILDTALPVSDAADAAAGTADGAVRALLRGWDGSMRAGSAPAAVMGVLGREIAVALAQRLAGPAAGVLLGEPAAPYARGSIATRLGGWTLDRLRALEPTDRARLVRAAADRAIGFLRDELGTDPAGWRWGAVHHVTFTHPLGAVPMLGARCSPGPFAAPGDLNTVWQGGTIPRDGMQATGDMPAYRQVIDLDDLDRSVFQLPTGNVGIPGHPRYADCVEEFFSGHYRPLLWSEEAVDGYAEHRLSLVPITPEDAADLTGADGHDGGDGEAPADD